jgi:hypothetical protein
MGFSVIILVCALVVFLMSFFDGRLEIFDETFKFFSIRVLAAVVWPLTFLVVIVLFAWDFASHSDYSGTLLSILFHDPEIAHYEHL